MVNLTNLTIAINISCVVYDEYITILVCDYSLKMRLEKLI